MQQPDQTLAQFAASSRALSSIDGASAAPRPTGDALAEMIDEAIEDLGEALTEDLEQGARLSVAYRVARALAGAQNHVAFDDALTAVPEAAWEAHTAATTQGHNQGAPKWLRELAGVEIGLVPTSADHAPAYGDALWSVAARLGLCDDPAAELGVLSLLDSIESGEPRTAPEWPTIESIIALEDSLVLHALHLATVSPPSGSKGNDATPASTAKAERTLRDMGFTEPEVQSLMALARARALELLPAGEAGRAMAYASLEDGVRRAQEAMDLRSEISFRKLQSMVMGHTRGEGPENQSADFIAVVQRVSARQDQAQLAEPRSVEALPAASRRTEEVEATVLEPEPEDDPEDGDALREFDAENG